MWLAAPQPEAVSRVLASRTSKEATAVLTLRTEAGAHKPIRAYTALYESPDRAGVSQFVTEVVERYRAEVALAGVRAGQFGALPLTFGAR